MFETLTCFLPISSWAGLMSIPTTRVKCGARSNVPCPDPQPTSTARSLAEFFWENAVNKMCNCKWNDTDGRLMNKKQSYKSLTLLLWNCRTLPMSSSEGEIRYFQYEFACSLSSNKRTAIFDTSTIQKAAGI